jgi:hypothetical protein
MSAKSVDATNAVAITATQEGEGRFTRPMLKRKTVAFNEKHEHWQAFDVPPVTRFSRVASVSPCKRLSGR